MTLATAYSTYINWPFSFLLPALVIPFLALPLRSAPSLRYGLWITTKLIAFAGLGTVLMLPIVIVGITLVPALGENSMDVGVEFAKGMRPVLVLLPLFA